MLIIYYSFIYTLYCLYILYFFFFFNDTATTEIYTLSLHDALPIFIVSDDDFGMNSNGMVVTETTITLDRKSTRLNSSHVEISYAVFCLKKKKNNNNNILIKNIKENISHSYGSIDH